MRVVRWAIFIALVLGALWVFGPRATMSAMPAPSDVALGDDLNAWLSEQEAAYDDIVPGTEKRIVWAGEAGGTTDWAVVYLHGFSASSEEIRPVPERVAEGLQANLFYTRYTGHARDSAAMAEATADAWARDTAEALAIAQRIGDRVLVIGTSTGGTMTAIAASDPATAEAIDAVVLISPNFAPQNPAAFLLTWPFAETWVPVLAGETRSWEPHNERQAEFWTERYPTIAAIPMQASVDRLQSADLGRADQPALVIYSSADTVVKPEATRNGMALWGGAKEFVEFGAGEGVDPSNHVLAGDILSPALTDPVTDLILGWMSRLSAP
ncbi:Alpha/beta hydrolase family protein [Rhodobacteraceae bacterium THAF1]|uniref:alpha/beta hydrolase n=1 Tax=Palleronia sp. THAF1 TaxID=2587842 RepID=UPI000F3BF66A|nr:alpha/beta fold hydrolase [Palleronia sp. THAF1]QFU09399.1 Alpha/beta hydrolase family protein [Palleronia sp. THAF1]VDC21988.1 Alpha/beta hydrolase family protein [Rhodobacteraceae bacterium THAF1]